MTQIPGVTVRKNAAGKITHITIDVEQQKALALPVLEQLTDKKELYNEEDDMLTLEESLASTLVLVDQLFDADEKS